VLRDRRTAARQLTAAEARPGQMNAKKEAIDSRINHVNNAAMKQAMTISPRPGSIRI
jgi:hypothetical protein